MFDIHRLAKNGDIEQIRIALATGIDVNQKNKSGYTPLLCAISGEQTATIEALLNSGADASIQDAEGFTSLDYAILHKLPTVLQALLKHCPQAISISNRHGNEPLWTAVFHARGDYAMVNMLLDCGADPEHTNKASVSPLDFAKRIADTVLVELLESKLKHRE